MGLQETVIKEEKLSKWRMPCCICAEHSESYAMPDIALKSIQELGWISKSYYLNLMYCQDWYCPKCKEKAEETRDTIPDIEKV